jgi:hypothetical protein
MNANHATSVLTIDIHSKRGKGTWIKTTTLATLFRAKSSPMLHSVDVALVIVESAPPTEFPNWELHACFQIGNALNRNSSGRYR